MALAHSKVTAQGQVSVPARVRQRLGIGPGSVLEWDEDGDRVVVRKAGRYSSEEIHRLLFSKPSPRRTVDEMKNGIRRYVKTREKGDDRMSKKSKTAKAASSVKAKSPKPKPDPKATFLGGLFKKAGRVVK